MSQANQEDYQLDEGEILSILEHFEELEDPRCDINRKHLLGELIVICICAVLGGADGPTAIVTWAQSKEAWLKQHLTLPYGLPGKDTFLRLLALLKPSAFQACFQSWIASLTEAAEKDHPSDERKIIAIDGKALRRSHDRQKHLGPLFLVSAWAVQHGISLGQLAAEEKSNEITAIPRLVEQIDVSGAIVTIDAAGCQKNIVAKIIEGEGDYLLSLKGNQETLCNAVRAKFTQAMEQDFADVTVRIFQEQVKGHGRVDTLTYYQMPAPASLPGKSEWKRLRTIGMVIRLSDEDGKQTSDVRHFISSLPLGVKHFAQAARGHWGIENTLHWSLDMTFREDESRTRNRQIADNLAWLRRFTLTLLKQQKDKHSIAMRRRKCGWDENYILLSALHARNFSLISDRRNQACARGARALTRRPAKPCRNPCLARLVEQFCPASQPSAQKNLRRGHLT